MSLLKNLFKTQKTPSYGGIQPYGTLMDAQGGSEYYQKILDRSNGIGGGYSSDYVDKASNPVIARMRNQFSSYDLPELKSELTATGRRAGSSGFQQLSKAYENQGLNEEAAYAPIYQQAEEAKRADTNTGISDLGAFNTGDYNARNTLAGFQQREYGQAVANTQNDNAANTSKAQNIGNFAVSAAGIPFTGGASALGSSPISYGGQTYATSQPPLNQQNYYQQMLGRGVATSGQKGRV